MPANGSRAPVGLTRAAVVTAALELIDEQGLDAFSVRALAKRMGVYPTALHWHAGSRSELIGLVVTRVVELVPVPQERGWEPFVRALAASFRDVLHRHPEIAPAFTTQVVSATAQLRVVDALLERLEGAGLRGGDLVDTYNALLGGIVGFVGVELATVPADDGQRWATTFRDDLDGVDADRFPALARHLPALRGAALMTRWEGGRTRPLDAGFAALVDLLVAGVRARLG